MPQYDFNNCYYQQPIITSQSYIFESSMDYFRDYIETADYTNPLVSGYPGRLRKWNFRPFQFCPELPASDLDDGFNE